MAMLGPRYSREQFAQRGQAIYERDIRPRLGAKDDGKFVVIDIETGAYEIDRDDFTATERLLVRRPHAQMWLIRVGQRTAYRLGNKRGQSPFINQCRQSAGLRTRGITTGCSGRLGVRFHENRR